MFQDPDNRIGQGYEDNKTIQNKLCKPIRCLTAITLQFKNKVSIVYLIDESYAILILKRITNNEVLEPTINRRSSGY